MKPNRNLYKITAIDSESNNTIVHKYFSPMELNDYVEKINPLIKSGVIKDFNVEYIDLTKSSLDTLELSNLKGITIGDLIRIIKDNL